MEKIIRKPILPQKISAQVSLRPGAGQAASAVAEAFERDGFAIGALVADNFSITSTPERFEERFKVHFGERGPDDGELPLAALRAELRDKIDRVVITRVPDFGPGDY